jgi:hypothetical protein
MSAPPDSGVPVHAVSVDRRTALTVYVPPTLVALGLLAHPGYSSSGPGDPPHPGPSNSGGGGGGGEPNPGNGGDGGNGGGNGGGGLHTARNPPGAARDAAHRPKTHAH